MEKLGGGTNVKRKPGASKVRQPGASKVRKPGASKGRAAVRAAAEQEKAEFEFSKTRLYLLVSIYA